MTKTKQKTNKQVKQEISSLVMGLALRHLITWSHTHKKFCCNYCRPHAASWMSQPLPSA